MRHCQLVIGLRHHGKSTYCKLMSKYAKSKGRILKLVNLDPCSQMLLYDEPVADIRDNISMCDYLKAEKQSVLPGSGLALVIKFLESNPEWLIGAKNGESSDAESDNYYLFDLPGFDVYISPSIYKPLVSLLGQKGFKVCVVLVRDARDAVHTYSYVEACTAQLGSILELEIPHIILMMKFDKLPDIDRSKLQKLINTEPRSALLKVEKSNRIRELTVLARHAGILINGYEYDPNRRKGFAMDIREEQHFNAFLANVDEMLGYGSINLSPIPTAY